MVGTPRSYWTCIGAVICLFSVPALGSASGDGPSPARPLIEQRLPDLPRLASGRIVGRTGGSLVVAGGRDSRTGELLAEVLVLPDGADAWQVQELDEALADAAAAVVGDDIICAGGEMATGVTAACFKLTLVNGELVQTPLPALPSPRTQAGAAATGSDVYVVGGIADDGTPAKASFVRLDPGTATAWEVLPSCPLYGIRRPIAMAQAGDILVFGGQVEASGRLEVVTDSRRYRPKRLDATTAQGWMEMADMPAGWMEPAAFPTGQSHVMVLGGRSALPGSGHDPRILIYHTITDAYATHSVWSGQVTGPQAVAWDADDVALIGTGPAATDGASAIHISFAHITRTLHAADYVVIFIYLGFLLGVGVYFANKEKTTKDFFLGGRKIPWWVVGISLYATGTSAISFMAIPTKTWTTSTLYGVEGLVGLVGMVASAYLVIPIVRRLDITSTYEYLERRYNRYMRMWGSALCISFQMGGRMSVVLLLPSLAISAVTGLPVMPCIAVMGILATVYTVMGGISAVIWTDVLQVIALFGGAILAFVLMVLGSDGGIAGWAATNMEYEKFRAIDASFDYTQPVIWIILLGTIIHVGTATSDQVMVQRVLSTPDVKHARRSYMTLALIVLPGSMLFTFLGTAMFGYFRAHPEMLNPTMENIHALPLFIVHGLPAGLTGLVIAALFAASMSTLDSSMNSVSTLIVTDFYRPFKQHATDHQCLILGKWLTGFVGLFGTGAALLMATFEIKSMFDMWMQLSALVMGGFGGVFILGMFTRRANGWGALIGAVASIGITACVKEFTPLHFWAYGSIAVLSCVIVGYLFSLVLPHRDVDLAGLTVFDSPDQTEDI